MDEEQAHFGLAMFREALRRFIRSSVLFVSSVNAMEAVRRLRREDARR